MFFYELIIDKNIIFFVTYIYKYQRLDNLKNNLRLI